MVLRAVVCGLLCLWGVAESGGQQQVEQKTSGGVELQRRQEPARKVEKVPPPAPLRAPDTLEPAKAPNTNAVYLALRQRGASGPSFRVKGLVLKRDAGELQLNDGIVTLFNAVNGRVTGAVFEGQGVLHIEPPNAMERHQLKLTMNSEVLNAPFTNAVLEFTDGTAEELKKGASDSATGVSAARLVEDAKTLFRSELKYDIE